jgi:DNA-binding FadR family transcriptional regulator
MENNIAGIPIEDLKLLAIKYEGDDSFESIQKVALKISVANCARISYTTLGDNPKIDYEADIRLHDMLAKSSHWSPFEHVARAMSDEEYNSFTHTAMQYDYEENYYAGAKVFKGRCGNFKGFVQYRHLVEQV